MSMTGTGFAALVWTMLVIAIVPGPSDIAVAARSAASGFRQAAYMVLGIIAADILFILIAMYGLTAVVRIHPSFVIGARIIAALILIGFGIRLLLTSASESKFTTPGLQSSASSLISGFAITLADPKAILFYMSLLPAFVDLSTATFADALIVLAAATAVIAAVKLNYAWLAGRTTGYFNRAPKPLHIIAGCTLLTIGASVLLQH